MCLFSAHRSHLFQLNESVTANLLGGFCAGDRERELGLPVSWFMDRSCPRIAECQVIDDMVFVIIDAYSC